MAITEVSKRISPVVDTMSADLLTPLSVYLKLAKSGGSSVLLESVEGGESQSRYSFIGVDPDFVVSGDESSVKIHDGTATRVVETSLIEFLRDELRGIDTGMIEDLPPFVGGAVGYMGFDCCGWFEPRLAVDQAPPSEFMFFRSIVAFDHAKQVVRIISLPRDSQDEDNAIARNASTRQILEDESTDIPQNFSPETSSEVSSNWTQPDFEDAVTEIKELIAAGECYQVVLSQCFSKKTFAHPVSIYRAMRSLNPSPYMFLLQFAERAVIGASPEMLVKCTNNRLEYRPIAGTRPRGKSTAEDESLAEEMKVDPKEVAEHVMLVDLGRNDLGRVAEYGSVKVDKLMGVEKYSHVQHLVSQLSGTLRSGLDRFDALSACFPAGTVSGAPKVSAIEVIRDKEPTRRGIYAGAVGYFDYAGNMDTCIAIRTLVLEDGVAKVQAGAGIVADSVPAAEYQETVNKARALLTAVELAEGKR